MKTFSSYISTDAWLPGLQEPTALDGQNNGLWRHPCPSPLTPGLVFLTWQKGLPVTTKVKDTEMGRLSWMIQVDPM